MLLLHTHRTKEIRETFKENEVILLLHTHMTKEIRETFKGVIATLPHFL
jgi:hypothetical protein